MSYNQFNTTNLKVLREELNAVLERHGADCNLDFRVGGMKYSDHDVTIQVTAKIKGELTFNQKSLKRITEAMGITSLKNARGEELVDYKPQNHKYPFIITKAGAKGRYKITEEQVRLRWAV